MKRILFSLVSVGIVFVNTVIADVVFNGVVRDAETGRPIENARIRYKYHSFDDYSFGTVSDRNGSFKVDHLVQYNLRYNVLAEAEGYQSKEIEIAFGKSVKSPTFEIKLQKEIEIEERKFTVKYRDGSDILKKIYQEMGSDVQVEIYHDNLLVVKGPSHKLDIAGYWISEFDKPPKEIKIQVMLLIANRGDRKEVEHHPKLKKIIKQLTSLFNYNYYWVIGEAEMIGMEDEPFTVMSEGQQSSFAMNTWLHIQDDVIQLKRMNVSVNKPTRAEIQTTVNIKNGETVILGASSGQNEGEAMITVVTAKIM